MTVVFTATVDGQAISMALTPLKSACLAAYVADNPGEDQGSAASWAIARLDSALAPIIETYGSRPDVQAAAAAQQAANG